MIKIGSTKLHVLCISGIALEDSIYPKDFHILAETNLFLQVKREKPWLNPAFSVTATRLQNKFPISVRNSTGLTPF